jgi:hypothetical protein
VALGDQAAVTATEVKSAQPANPCVKHCVRDFENELRLAMGGSMALGFAIVIGGQLASGAAGSFAVPVQVAAAVVGGMCVFGSLVLLAGRRWVPAQEMLQWQGDRVAGYFAEIDDHREVPRTPQETLDRVAGKEGPSALFQRIGALHQLGRDDEARALIDSWRPSELSDTVRRERIAAIVGGGDGDGDSHLERARAAVELIQDEAERCAQRANLLIDAARVRGHEMWPGLDALTAARAELGRFYTPSAPPAKNPRRVIRGLGLSLGAIFACVGLLIPLFR